MSKTRNKLTDLNNHLFMQLERLGDEDLTEEELNKEIERSKAISGVAKNIINNANIMLQAFKHADEYGYKTKGQNILMLSGSDED